MKLTTQYTAAEDLHKTNLKEKPEEFANTPIVITVDEAKNIMTEVMKD